jgi:phage-related protein
MPQAMPLQQYISENSVKTVKHRTLVSKFGDGYSQRAADGLNSKVYIWDVRWIPLQAANRDTIIAVLDAVGCWDYLTWIPPSEGASIKLVLVDEYSIDIIGDRYRISAQFQQVFDL